jgi:hypothetical protein
MSQRKIIIISALISLVLTLLIAQNPIKRVYYNLQEYFLLNKSIVWNPDVELTVSDFQFVPDESYIDNFSARVGIANVHRLSDSIILRSTTVFLPKDSYVTDTSDLYFLRIAKARFDLCEVYRRKLELKIWDLNKRDINSITNDTIEKYEQLFYDQFEAEWDKFNEFTENEKAEGLIVMENFIESELNKTTYNNVYN